MGIARAIGTTGTVYKANFLVICFQISVITIFLCLVEPGMRVGSDYQAQIPEMLPVDNYLKDAKDQYGYNIEQALGMLYWHSYESDKAMEDLRNFTPLPDEWSMEDKLYLNNLSVH